MRQDRFRLRVGADELRLSVIYLIWLVLYVAMVTLIYVALALGAEVNIALSALFGIVNSDF